MKPFAESCEQNKQPIGEVLQQWFVAAGAVLEIGSGTGQHAVYFAARLPHLTWHPSDCRQQLAGIELWRAEAALANVQAPLALDVAVDPWPSRQFDYVFSANTAHIMGWPQVTAMFAGAGRVLRSGGVFCLYGPFNYDGVFTSPSNASFDTWLRQRDPHSGLRDFADLDRLARAQALTLVADHAMPVNNRTLVWRRD